MIYLPYANIVYIVYHICGILSSHLSSKLLDTYSNGSFNFNSEPTDMSSSSKIKFSL